MRPREVDRLTEAELCLCLDDNLEEKRGAAGEGATSPHDVIAHARKWRSMTVAERLAHHRARGD